MITMPDAVTFASGSANLIGEGKMIIDKVWEVLNRHPDRKILVEGHTDNVPIAPQHRHRYRSNWELSAAHPLAVVHYVRGKFEADRLKMAVTHAINVGRSDRPTRSNEHHLPRRLPSARLIFG